MSTCPPEFSAHARLRMHQRGVRNDRIQQILDYGRRYHAGNGASVYWLCHRAVLEALTRFGLRLESHSDWAVVVAASGEIITIYKADRRQRHWRPGGRRV